MNKSVVWVMLAVAGGCAASPPPSAEPRLVKVDASNVVAVQQAGYKLVNKDGQPLYCRTDPITGSRIQTRTVCLTERELQAQMSATNHAMDSFTSKQAGPSGH